MNFKFEAVPVTKRESLTKEKEIDGLNYKINLNQTADDPNCWELGFSANNSESITNKGLGTFNKLAEVIEEFIEESRLNKQIKKIRFESSNEVGGDKKLQGILQKKYNENPSSFLNFNYSATEKYDFGNTTLGETTRSFKIDGEGRVFGERLYVSKANLMLLKPFANGVINKYIEGEDVEKFLSTPANIALLRRGELRDALPNFLEHLDLNIEEEKIRDNKHPDQQRTKLYERVLKQKFPQFKYSKKNDQIEIDFEKQEF